MHSGDGGAPAGHYVLTPQVLAGLLPDGFGKDLELMRLLDPTLLHLGMKGGEGVQNMISALTFQCP